MEKHIQAKKSRRQLYYIFKEQQLRTLSRMDKENIFQQMATYDFKTPVKVKTIIEDSDEDSVIELSSETNSNYDNNAKAKEKETQSTNSAKIKSAFFETNSCKRQEINNSIDSLKNNCNRNLDTDSNHETNEKNLKRKPVGEQQSKTNQQNSDTKRSKYMERSVNTKTNQSLLQSNDNDKVSNKELSFLEKSMSYNDNSLKISIQINDVEKISSYISDLLTAVSKQLITVIRAYNLYTRVTGVVNGDPTRKQEALKAYLYVRHQCFNLSYITVMNILLPEENNKLFVNSFIESTVKIANLSYNEEKFTIQQVQIFFSELLEWTKKKKNTIYLPKNHDTSNSNSSSDKRYCQLRQTLAEPVKSNLNNVHSQDTLVGRSIVENTSNTCLYSGGPPGKEVRINIQSDILTQQLGHISGPPSLTQIKKNNPITGNQEISKTNEQKNRESREILNQNIPPAYGNNNFQEPHLTTEIPLTKQTAQQNRPQFIPSKHSHFSMRNSTSSQQPNNKTIPNMAPVINGELSQRQYQEPLPPPPYEVHCNWQNNFSSSCADAVYSNQNQNKQLTSPVHIGTMRSLSTDSGFISPLNFNPVSESDQPINTVWQDVNNTPQITHVTSLNPNASFSSEGLCHVCGKITKKKCLGCLQYYYCQFDCQKVDWNTHMTICRRIR